MTERRQERSAVAPPQAVYFGTEAAAWIDGEWTDEAEWILEGTSETDAIESVVEA